MNMDQNTTNIFLSYDQKDELSLRELEAHLSSLKNQGLISTWYNQQIVPGTNWAEAINEHLEQASIIILLISADFLASGYHYQVEMKRALARDKAGQAHVIPIIIRECDWISAPFAHLQVLPTDARPITRWPSKDQAWTDVVTGIRRVLQGEPLQSACAPPPPIWNVPFPRNRLFLGQDALLTHLHHLLMSRTTTALTQIQAISGLGGIGKTQLAIEYAFRNRKTYPFVFWVRAEHHETLLTDFASLASLLRLPEKQGSDQMRVVDAVKQWLATHQGWLLIFDNVEDISLLSPFTPESQTGAILITTRTAQTRPFAEPLLVEQMEELVGAKLLLRRARVLLSDQTFEEATPEDQQAARQVCQLVGGLPLALDQAGAYIDETQCTVQDYLNFYQQEQPIRTRLLQRRGKVTTGHPEPVATTWALAFAKVEQDNPAAADLLRACAFLDPDLIPEELLRQGASHWGTSLASVTDNPFLWNETVGELLKYALVQRNRKQQTLSIHRLVQTVLRDAMDESTRHQWAEQTVRAVHQVFPKGYEPTDWATCKRLLSHARACALLIERYDFSFAEAASLLDQTASYLREHALYSEAERSYWHALRIVRRNPGLRDPHMIYSLDGLATLYMDQGKYAEAERLYQQAIQIAGPELSSLATLHNLATLYIRQGKYKEAESLYLTELPIKEQVFGPNHPEVATSLHNLATLYVNQGRYTEAESLYQQVLQIFELSLGPEHLNVSAPLNELASLYRKQGRHTEAESLYQRALQISERSLGSDHPKVADVLNNLAILYDDLDKDTEAELLYRRALQIYELSLGPDHPVVASVLHGLADLYGGQSKYAEAESLYQRALQISERSLGPDHPKVAHMLNNFAGLYCYQGKYMEAEPLIQRALRIYEQLFGTEHPNIRSMRKNYTVLLEAMGRISDS